MVALRALLGAVLLLCIFPVEPAGAQGQQAPPTIQVTSRLVFLDMTVLDRSGHPVVKGLAKDDFLITEDKKPQRIFSFEAPDVHVVDANASGDNPAGKAPVTIFVLDLLNSRFQDFAYIRYEMRKYLNAQPAQLAAPGELMVLGNESLQMVQGYTRSKADLLSALAHVPAVLPYKMNGGNAFYGERFGQSVDALQQISLQNQGVPGRKNIVWVGHGGPSFDTTSLPGNVVEEMNRYVHDTTNMLVNARVSLFVLYPGLRVDGGIRYSELSAEADIGEDDPFAGDINFGVFVNETGGKLFYNRNDVDAEIARSQELGSAYYTLTYQPPQGEADGKFRRIRVTMRDPNLHVLTKAGYFAPGGSEGVDARQQTIVDISEAAQSTVPFQALELTIADVVRHPDTGTAQFTVLLRSKSLGWQPEEDGKSSTKLMLAAVSLNGQRQIVASKVQRLKVTASTQDAALLPKTVTRFPVMIRVPRKTEGIRVVVQTAEGGRMGSVDLDRKTLDAAPEAPTPEPKLVTRPPQPGAPAVTPGP